MKRLENGLAVAALGAGLGLIVIGLGIWLSTHQFDRSVTFPLLTGVALLIVSAILEPTAAVDLVRSRQARFGSLSVVISAAVLGILVLLNVLAAQGVQTLDLTNARLHSLSPQSKLVADQLGKDVRMVGFWGRVEDHSTLSQLLALYQAESPHVKVAFEDPNSHLADVRRYGVTTDQTLVIDYPGKTPVLLASTNQTEQDVTSALLKLEQTRSVNVCWVVGEGESSLDDSSSQNGYGGAATQLANANIKTESFLLAQQKAVPSTCDVVALMAPQNALSDAAVASLKDYLSKGGKLLVAASPWQPAVTKSINAALADLGVSFTDGLVIDDQADSATGQLTVPAVTRYSSASPITKGLANQASFFPQATSVSTDSASGATTDGLATTSPQAYELPVQRSDPSQQAADPKGPFTLMASVESSGGGPDTRVVMVGTAGFAGNAALGGSSANAQLFTGSIQWLANQSNLISIPAKPTSAVSMNLTGAQTGFDVFVSFILLPLLVLAGGAVVWYRRRRLVP